MSNINFSVFSECEYLCQNDDTLFIMQLRANGGSYKQIKAIKIIKTSVEIITNP